MSDSDKAEIKEIYEGLVCKASDDHGLPPELINDGYKWILMELAELKHKIKKLSDKYGELE